MSNTATADRIPDLLPETFSAPSPIEILEKQASLIAARTGSILEGMITSTQSAEIFPWHKRGMATIIAFEISVRSTGDVHRLFNVMHETGKHYPLTIRDVPVSLSLPSIVETEEQYLDSLRKIFASAYCREVIRILMEEGSSTVAEK